ncbi:hypothetical protein BAUCODRAFT_77717 [Baudoinia panamericana UAMH 10762]|uniref:Uncharacterized protein n=1 Tax=Baudoinia panamericana (strain UAMH 10762) TaxID=717646 RepID=M2M789_BAUPA|nr:uncharacterized protein BAUCODRAFT_77717 [Baudoinia panamericana UAMH 10762]EMC92176.1 hypothetical protein BAUCODRAFT_77717 [Baudoinia panamericana UAMH 10762]
MSSTYLPVLPVLAQPAAKTPLTTSTAVEAGDSIPLEDLSTRQRPAFVSRDSRNSLEEGDAERGNSLPTYTDASDPYSLRQGYKSGSEILTIRNNAANVGKKRVVQGAFKARRLQGFYEQQNENIDRMLKPVSDLVSEAREQRTSEGLRVKVAVIGSFVANIILAILQIYGAVTADSLSLFTTMADAIFDPLSNLTLILCHRAINRVDASKYPSGKARIETAGNIAFCFLMTAVSFILIVQSAVKLVEGNGGEIYGHFNLPSVIAVAIAFCTKLGLFLYCWALKDSYSQINILWEDHRNDLFINGFGLLTSIGGSKLRWWIDPMGAIVLSVLIAFLWTRTAYSEFQLLIGKTAETSFLQHVTYVSMTHSPAITALDTVRAWHSGPRLIVEVDVVVDQEMTVKDSHDVAEELQMKLESLPDVERAYVHIDYETSHAPEHFTKKQL